jgi:hypothetical protein
MLSDNTHDSCFPHPSPIAAFGAIYHDHSVRKRDNTVCIRAILETGPPGTEAIAYPDRIWNYPASSSVGATHKTPSREYVRPSNSQGVRNACKLYLHTPMHLRGCSASWAESQIYVRPQKTRFLFICHWAQRSNTEFTRNANFRD